jgi:UDP-N-acetylglucosamine enolpyruvyl transferase
VTDQTLPPAAIGIYADGDDTQVRVHMRAHCKPRTADYPAEGRMVVSLPGGGASSVDLFVPSVDALGALIEILNDSYVRLTTPPRKATLPCAPSAPAGAYRRSSISQRLAVA